MGKIFNSRWGEYLGGKQGVGLVGGVWKEGKGGDKKGNIALGGGCTTLYFCCTFSRTCLGLGHTRGALP